MEHLINRSAHCCPQLSLIVHKIIQMEGAFILQHPDLPDAPVEDFLHGIELVKLADVAEGPAEDGHLAAQAVVLLDDHLGGDEAPAQGGDAAEAVETSGQLHLAAEALDGSVAQKLKHEGLVEAQGEVIESDVDLVDAIHFQDGVQKCGCLLRLQKEHGFGPSVHDPEEPVDLLDGLEVGEHDDVGPGLDDGLDLLLGGGTVFFHRIGIFNFCFCISAGKRVNLVVDGIDADQKFRLFDRGADGSDVLDGVVVLDGVQTALALGLADIFHVDEDPVDAVVLCDHRHVGAVGDIHELESHAILPL